MVFQDHPLDISFHEESSLNRSGKKRTLSETLEDELLGATSTDVTREEDEHDQEQDDEEEDHSGEPDAKRPHRSQTSDTEENEEERLLADEEGKELTSGYPLITSLDESNPTDEFDLNDLNHDDEVHLLDS